MIFSGCYVKKKKTRVGILFKYTWSLLWIDHKLGHKTNFNKFKSTNTVSIIFSDHNGMKLEINHRKRSEGRKRLHGD